MSDDRLRYLEDGIEVDLVEETKSGFLVRPRYYFDDEEQPGEDYELGSLRIVDKVYKTAPEIKLHPLVKEAQEKLTSIRNEVNDLLKQKRNLNDELHRLRADVFELSRNGTIPGLIDFLQNKFTHVVHVATYATTIYSMEELKNPGEKRIRLITYEWDGKSGFSPYLYKYSDGSGSAVRVTLHKSLEEAKESLSKYIAGIPKERLNTCHIRAIKEYDLPGFEAALEYWSNAEIRAKEIKLERLKESVEKLSAELSK